MSKIFQKISFFALVLSLAMFASCSTGSQSPGDKDDNSGEGIELAAEKELADTTYKDISWIELADVEFENKYYEEIDTYLQFPAFGDRVKALENKKVTLPGFIIPADAEAGVYVLSAFNMSSCFFCGAAGPESIVQLELKPGHRAYKTDEWLTFKGILRLNDSDVDMMNYILVEAEEIK